MKLLAFVDSHGSLGAMKKIKEKAKKADIIVCAGDFTVFGQNMDYFLKKLNALGKPLLIIHGNHEDEFEVEKRAQKYKNIKFLHAKGYNEEDYLFLAYGGGGFSMKDKEFEKLSKEFGKEIKKNPEKKVILITHAPPYKTKIDKIMNESCGNKSITNFIKKVNLHLVISGHLHENAGKEDRIGKTKVINPGPYGKVLTI